MEKPKKRHHIKVLVGFALTRSLLHVGPAVRVWEFQKRAGSSQKRIVGMRKSKALFYEDRACELQYPLACEVLERDDNQPSLAPKR